MLIVPIHVILKAQEYQTHRIVDKDVKVSCKFQHYTTNVCTTVNGM